METVSTAKSPPATPQPSISVHGIGKSTAAAARLWHRTPWKWFFSLKVGIVILILLTIASIFGTMIAPLERAQALVFYTWWYKLLLLALAINMTCATVKTVIQKLLPTRALRVHPQKGFYQGKTLCARIPFQGTAADAGEAFRRQGFNVRVEGKAGAARTGWLGRFGAPVSHAGMVIVLLAGFASNWVAKEGVVQVPEGRTTTTMQMRNANRDVVPLGFALTINDFDTGFHPRTRIPSHYISNITARDGQQRLLYTGPVEVNHSPKINGWRVHQTSYQELENLARYEVEIGGEHLAKPTTVKVSPGQTLALTDDGAYKLAVDNRMNWTVLRGGEKLAAGSLLPGAGQTGSLSLVAHRFEPDFVLGENRAITSRSNELNNPALHVKLLNDGTPIIAQWLFGREDMRGFSHSPDANYRLELLDIHRGESGDSFVVSVGDSKSGAVIARALLTLGEEQVIKAAASAHAGDHHDCESCASAAAASPGPSAGGDATNGWSVALGSRVTAYATVLTLTRNPAIPTIYFGCVLMMIGLMMSFAMPRREVWFLHDKDRKELLLTARYRHPAEEFDRATRTALTRLSDGQTPSPADKEQ